MMDGQGETCPQHWGNGENEERSEHLINQFSALARREEEATGENPEPMQADPSAPISITTTRPATENPDKPTRGAEEVNTSSTTQSTTMVHADETSVEKTTNKLSRKQRKAVSFQNRTAAESKAIKTEKKAVDDLMDELIAMNKAE